MDDIANNPLQALRLGAPDRLPEGRMLPLAGWPVLPSAKLDEVSPGWLRHVMGSGLLYRNCVWLAFSNGVLDDPVLFLERANGEPADEHQNYSSLLREVAEALRRMRPVEIIEAACGTCPPGLKGALSKIGLEPLQSPESYVCLHHAFISTAPDDQKRRKVLEQLGSIDEHRLDAVMTLDLGVLTPTLATKITTGDQARAFNSQVAMIRTYCSTATDEALRHSIENRARWTGLASWTREWIDRADKVPETGLSITDPEIERVLPANARNVGRHFRNCLGSKASRLASGVWAAFIWRPEDVLVTTTKLVDGAWLLTGVHGVANVPVDRDTVEKVAEKFSSYGVTCLLPASVPRDSVLFEFEPDFTFGGDLFEFELGEF